ncbi:MAG: twin-arginine translocase subunit TatC [Phycisphaerales bacterium]|nr:twin-arginine translocase subunit TatC [Phycisphaerales bacterium]
MKPGDLHTMSFGEHLEELRTRLILALLGAVPILVLSFLLGRHLLGILIDPVQVALLEAGHSASLQATSPLETFGSYLRVSLVMTIIVGAPWFLWQLWKFIAPGLYNNERRFVYFLIPLSAIMTVVGVLFLYFVILPVILSFFINFGMTIGENAPEARPLPEGIVTPMVPVLEFDPLEPETGAMWVHESLRQLRVCIGYEGETPVILGIEMHKGVGIVQQYRVSEYIKLFMGLTLAFALGFQMPVAVLLLGWAGIVERSTLKKYRRHAAFGCSIAAAFLTPADPMSMLLLAVPLYVLYEFGNLLLYFFPASRIAGEGRNAGDE